MHIEPAVAELRSEGFRIETINVRNNQHLAQQYHIRVVPTFVYVVDGEEVRRQTGGGSKEMLRMLWRPKLF